MQELEFLYQQARSLLEEQVSCHIIRCVLPCSEGQPCPRILAAVTFLKETKNREVKKC